MWDLTAMARTVCRLEGKFLQQLQSFYTFQTIILATNAPGELGYTHTRLIVGYEVFTRVYRM